MAYNATVYVNTGHAPFNLFYSFQSSCPLDVMTETPLAEAAHNADTYAYQAHYRLQMAFAYVRQETGKQATRAKAYYDMSVKQNAYQVNDLILVFTPQKSKGKFGKWVKFWRGPFCIICIINSVNFVVQKSPKAKPFVVHANRLRRYYGDAVHGEKLQADTQACKSESQSVVARPVRRRRHAAAAEVLLTPPPPIITDRRAAAAAEGCRHHAGTFFVTCCTIFCNAVNVEV